MTTDRPRWWVVGPLLLLVVVVVAVATWLVASPGDNGEQPYAVSVPPSSSAELDPAGAAQALQRLVTAIDDRDRNGAVALAAADDIQTRDRLAALIEVAREARLGDVAMRYIDADGVPAADGSWAATVDATWAYAGFDEQPATAEVSMRFRASPSGVVIAGVGGGDLRTPVWMSGSMRVQRSTDLLVVAARDLDLDAYVRLSRAAVPTVTSVVSSWRPRLVVEVPADAAALESALGVDQGYYDQIAAVTGNGGALSPGAPVHVYVNPAVFSTLGRAGREVVLAHEAVHVATDAPSSTAPTWFTEGFADYVALRGTRLPLTRTAGQIAQQVRDFGLPRSLPAASEFDTRGPHLGAVYEASWLACVALSERKGTQQMTDLYLAVSDGEPFATAVRRFIGVSERQLVSSWRTTLAGLPGAGPSPARGS